MKSINKKLHSVAKRKGEKVIQGTVWLGIPHNVTITWEADTTFSLYMSKKALSNKSYKDNLISSTCKDRDGNSRRVGAFHWNLQKSFWECGPLYRLSEILKPLPESKFPQTSSNLILYVWPLEYFIFIWFGIFSTASSIVDMI